ncbi:MBL fold metallo-hydrolase [Amnibacterium flavum]|uniref:MBL fold metallo-hydrolase n=1 Tax=Amnibacterium flavum TaxID=2173173 RepID=A0A2V1HUX5_9MICO|nr:MBL fold metallo-hydrolase [Amnibacterium flavum]PVZ96398.1 MBL fold metallo-hydrolase [Amnibacterium flavum]
MRVTKLEHSTLRIDQAGKTLFLDPGALTTAITETGNTVAIVITHEHPDHWSEEQLNRILANNPDAKIYGPEGVALAASGFDVQVVAPGDTVTIEPFTLRFFGGRHAVIHPSIPVIDNVGVLINDALYYPGDSFSIPEDVKIDTLATPASAPWLKISEVMDFVTAVAPARTFPMHDMPLSQIGKNLHYARIKDVTEAAGGEFFPLQPGETIDL